MCFLLFEYIICLCLILSLFLGINYFGIYYMSESGNMFCFSYSLKLNVVILPVNPRFFLIATQKKSYIHVLFRHKNTHKLIRPVGILKYSYLKSVRSSSGLLKYSSKYFDRIFSVAIVLDIPDSSQNCSSWSLISFASLILRIFASFFLSWHINLPPIKDFPNP